MISILLSRVLGLVREMVIAHIGGTSTSIDAYQIAFILPEILNHIVASGFLSITFIPIFTKYLINKGEREAWKIFSNILNIFTPLLVFLIILLYYFAPMLVPLVAPGINNPETLSLAIHMTRIMIPAQFFFFLGGLFMAVQYAKEQFLIPALAPLIYNTGIILGGLLLCPLMGIEGLSWGVLLGALIGNFILQYYGARKAGLNWNPILQLNHPEVKKYLFLTLPLIIGLGMTYSTELFFKFFGSFLPAGSIAALNYGLRLMFILVGIFGQAAGVASFPFLSQLIAQNNIKEVNQILNHTLCRYIALVIPFSILMIILRVEIVRILFQRGEFSIHSTQLTAQALAFLLIGTFAFAAQTIIVRGYYATQNTLFPSIFTTLAVLTTLPLYWLGLTYYGISGVAMSVSLAAILQSSLLYYLWNRKTNNQQAKSVYLAFLKIIIVSLLVGGIVYFIKESYLSVALTDLTLFHAFSTCLIAGLIYIVLLLIISFYVPIIEIKKPYQYLFNKVIKKKI